MPYVKFTEAYDHKWPRNAVTHFPKGYAGTVKKEVFDAAKKKGVATETKRPETEPAEPVDTDGNSG